jgi:integrase
MASKGKVARVNLTDRLLKSLQKDESGERIEKADTVSRGLRVRALNGNVFFVLLTRFPGSPHPTRGSLGEYPALSLEDAREKAGEWRKLIKKGQDPREVEEAERRAEQRKRDNGFEAIAEQFIRYIQRIKLRTAPQMEHDLRETFIPRWRGRPVAEITSGDVRQVIEEAVDREAPYTAFKQFALVRRFFNWAIGTDKFGLEINPCDRLDTRDLIGERHARERTLTDDELRALWRATRHGYPYAPLYRLLVLAGVRLNEACGARWPEFDLERKEWTIPAERMKKVKGGAKPHVVPLTPLMIEVLQSIPRFKAGDCLFSNSMGRQSLKPNQFSDVKAKLDRRVLRTLRAMARMRGQDPERVVMVDWVNHDIRRSVRTHLSALRISDEVREAVLAHVRPGIKAVYDRYAYLDEKREALELWSARLLSIVALAPANVVALKRVG